MDETTAENKKPFLQRLFGRNQKALPDPSVYELGARGRDSVDEPYEVGWYDNSEIAPTRKPGPLTRRLNFSPIKLEDIKKRPVSDIIAEFIDSNSDLSFIVRSYQDYTLSDFELETDNDASRRRIEGFIDDMGRGGDNFLAFLKRLIYGIYVEGGCSQELNWSEDGKRPRDIKYVSPWTLEWQYAVSSGGERYYRIVQYQGVRRTPIILQDQMNPNPFFRYTPVNLSGTNPYGNSSVEPALWGIVGKHQLMGMLLGFVQGQILPKGAWAPDLRALLSASPNMNLTAKDILQFGEKVAEVVKRASDGSDITQDFVSSFPLIYEVIGATKDANFEPLQVMSTIFATAIQNGGRLPSILYQPENLRSGIGDRKTTIDWTSFDNRCESVANLIEDEVTPFFDLILLGDRSTDAMYEPAVRLKIKRNDAEIRRIRSESFKMKMEGYKLAKELEVFTDAEFREIVVEDRYDFEGFDVKRPMDDDPDPEEPEDTETPEGDME